MKRKTVSTLENTNIVPSFFDVLDSHPLVVRTNITDSNHVTGGVFQPLPFLLYKTTSNGNGITYLDFSKDTQADNSSMIMDVDVDSGNREKKKPKSDLKGLCDTEHPISIIQGPSVVFTTLTDAIKVLDNRRTLFIQEGRGLEEHVFSYETPRSSAKNHDRLACFGKELGPKDVTRSFVIMSYDGLASYFEAIYSKHIPFHPEMDIHRKANFHEVLEYDRKPYKIFVDLDCKYNNSELQTEISSTTNTTNDVVNEFVECYIELGKRAAFIINRLNTYWKRFKQEIINGESEEDFSVKVTREEDEDEEEEDVDYIILDSSRFPETIHTKEGQNVPSIDGLIWKVSFHIIWFPKSIRFANQGSVTGFLLSALAFNKVTNMYEEDFMEKYFSYKGREVFFDSSVYGNVAFRLPYNSKFGSFGKYSFPPILKPVGVNGTLKDLHSHLAIVASSLPSTLLNSRYNNDFVPFKRDLFLKGLIHHIDPEQPVKYIIQLNVQEISHTCFLIKQFPAMAKLGNGEYLDRNLSKLVNHYFMLMNSNSSSNSSTTESVTSTTTTTTSPPTSERSPKITILPSDSSNTTSIPSSIAAMPSSMSQASLETLLILFGEYFAKEVAQKCNYFYNSVPSNTLHKFSFKFQMPIWPMADHDIFIYHTVGYYAIPCLAGDCRSYRPHRNNNTFVVLNIHNFCWYMGCHDTECVKNFRNSLPVTHPMKILPPGVAPGSKNDKLKARSPIFQLPCSLENPSEAFFYCKQISNIMFNMRMVVSDNIRENDSNVMFPENSYENKNGIEANPVDDYGELSWNHNLTHGNGSSSSLSKRSVELLDIQNNDSIQDLLASVF
jgi:hypothetical protein